MLLDGPILYRDLDGKVVGDPRYRGVFRTTSSTPNISKLAPTTASELSEAVEQLDWSGEPEWEPTGENPDVLHSLKLAKELAQIYKRYLYMDLEIVEVTIGQERPDVGTQLLGFDVALDFYDTLLKGILGDERAAHMHVPWDAEQEALLNRARPLYVLIEIYFRSKLNENALFDDYTTAKLYLDCVLAMQSFAPALYPERFYREGYKVYGLYKVTI